MNFRSAAKWIGVFYRIRPLAVSGRLLRSIASAMAFGTARAGSGRILEDGRRIMSR